MILCRRMSDCKKERKTQKPMRTVTVNAYAKINSFLAVTGRRPDGYHTLLSHMQAVSLCDELTAIWTPEEGYAHTISLSCDDSRLACDESNLICRAAREILDVLTEQRVAVGGSWKFYLKKKIPMAAGLGGGSADAAAALRAVNALAGEVLSMDELCRIGVRIGADVPFCLRCEKGGLTAQGIGERLTGAPSFPAFAHLIIAVHGEGVSTPWAYRRLDERGSCGENVQERYASFLEALQMGDLAAMEEKGVNHFEDVVIPERAAVAGIMRMMKECGAPFVRMSGSGPSVVAAFDNKALADACLARLQKEGVWAHYARPQQSI